MAASNTNILIKRSSTTGKPSSLKAGEFAYSYVSNTLFFGTTTGDGVINIGGQYYTSTLDSATSSNTASTLVKRNADGNFFGRLLGNANTATVLETGRNFSISGGDITASAESFDGSSAVVLNASLNSVPGLSAGVYGGVTAIPVLEVAANGRVMAISNTTVSTTLNISGDTGTDGVNLLNDTLTFNGGQGITTAVTDNVVSIFVDDTVVRSNTSIGTQTINSSVTISGNLSVLGTEFITNTVSLNIVDPLIYLASNNYYSDIVDVGFVGNYFDGVDQRHAGVMRHAADKEFYIFDNLLGEPENVINVDDPSFRTANVNTGYIKSRGVITPTANVYNTLTLPSGSQLYANGSTYFANAPLFDGGATLDGNLVVNSANHLQLKNSDNSATLDVYNSGGAGVNVLYVDSAQTTLNGDLTVNNANVNNDLRVTQNIYASGIPNGRTGNLVYFDTANGRFSYADDNALTPTSIANGIYSYTVSGDDGGLRSNVSSQIIGGTEGGIKISYWSGANTGMQIQNEIVGEDLFINAFDTGRALLRWHSTSVDPEVANSRVLFSAQSDGAYIKNVFWDSNTASYLTHAWWFKPNGTLSLPHSAIINDANNSIDIGYGTKTGIVGVNRVSIGTSAGLNAQGTSAIAIGDSAGNSNQSARAIALGYFAGPNNQGQDSIAIGSFAGQYGAVQGSIILNASGSAVNGNNSGFFVSPMSYTAAQDSTYDGIMFYNNNTKEVRYSYALDGGEF